MACKVAVCKCRNTREAYIVSAWLASGARAVLPISAALWTPEDRRRKIEDTRSSLCKPSADRCMPL